MGGMEDFEEEDCSENLSGGELLTSASLQFCNKERGYFRSHSIGPVTIIIADINSPKLGDADFLCSRISASGPGETRPLIKLRTVTTAEIKHYH